MNILSLFDGISCGQVALERIGVKNYNYFSSEIDKYAIQITQKNYPNTIQLGNIEKILYRKGKLYSENGDFDIGKIDLLMGGSPCQGFSFAGKQLNFNDPRSFLFFEFVRLLDKCKPKWFLLENVVMKREYQDVISQFLGVEPIMINSALVSAQNRKRLYWTNIPDIKQPKDKKILLKDILNGYTEKEVMRDNWLKWWTKKREYLLRKKYCSLDSDKAICMTARQYANWNGNFITCERNKKLIIRKFTPIECERLQTLPDNYTQGISNTQRYKCIGNGWTVDVITHILKNIRE